MQEMARRYGQLKDKDVDIPRRFRGRSPDWSYQWRLRVVPCDVTRIDDSPRLRIKELVAVLPVVVPKVKEVAQPDPKIRLALPRDSVIGGLKEGQQG